MPEFFCQNYKGNPLNGAGIINIEDIKKVIELRYKRMGKASDKGVPKKLIELDLGWLIYEVK